MALPERDAIAEQANLTQRVKTYVMHALMPLQLCETPTPRSELKSQLNFGAEWGSLMEGDAKPGATIEDEIVRRKQQLKQCVPFSLSPAFGASLRNVLAAD